MLNRNENHSYSQIKLSSRCRGVSTWASGSWGKQGSVRGLGQARFHAGDLAGPAAFEDRASLSALAEIILQIPPVDRLALFTRPEHECRVRGHDGNGRHEFLTRGGLLRRDVVE